MRNQHLHKAHDMVLLRNAELFYKVSAKDIKRLIKRKRIPTYIKDDRLFIDRKMLNLYITR